MVSKDDYDVVSIIDRQRTKEGVLSVKELLQLCDSGNTILDPFSVLISSSVKIGCNNIFYPNVIIKAVNNGTITVGNENSFFPNSLLLADRGKIEVGNANQFGDGGISVKANTPTSIIIIGDRGRYINGVQVLGQTVLGSGSQIIGNITAQDCRLEQGEKFSHSNPDLRGGVLKGYGLARNIQIKVGMVLNGLGSFNQHDVEYQSTYHPK